MIVVHILPSAIGLPSISPYCAKLIAWLQLSGVEHETRLADFRRAPYGKVPFIEDGDKLVGDSHLIAQYVRQTYGKGLFDELTEAQRGLGHAIMRLGEESVYWTLVWERFCFEPTWPHFRPVVATTVPKAVAWALVPLIRRQTRKQLHAQGTGRLPVDTIYQILDQDLKALSQLLGDKPYFIADRPTDYDLSVWAPLAGGHASPWPSRFKDTLAKYDNLVAFVDRIETARLAKESSSAREAA